MDWKGAESIQCSSSCQDVPQNWFDLAMTKLSLALNEFQRFLVRRIYFSTL